MVAGGIPAALILFGLLARPAIVSAQSEEWTVIRGEMRAECPLNIGGAIEARSMALTGRLLLTPGPTRSAAFAGNLQLDLSSIDTGIDLRNHHLRENYLDVAKGPGFDAAVLSDLVLPDIDPVKPGGKARFTAQLLLHGIRKPVSGMAEIRTLVNTARVQARFPLRLSDHAIPPPRYLGVGVQNEIQVVVSLVLEMKAVQK